MNDNVEYAGPWTSAKQACAYLGVNEEELTRMLADHEILGCEFASGNVFFPTRQFNHGRVVDGLVDVLAVFAAGGTHPETCALWLAGPTGGVGPTGWENLSAGRLELVMTEVRRDVYRWTH